MAQYVCGEELEGNESEMSALLRVSKTFLTIFQVKASLNNGCEKYMNTILVNDGTQLLRSDSNNYLDLGSLACGTLAFLA